MAARWAAGLMVLVAAVGCGESVRDPKASGTLYACSAQTDCLDDYTCFCGFCQQPGQTAVCLDATTDAGPTSDASSTGDAAADITGDTVPSDAKDTSGEVVTGCHLVTWAKCPAGQGCYYDSGGAKTLCTPHGSLAWGNACEPGKLTQCGQGQVGGAARPLVCDTVDKKCYFTCTCQGSGPACPSGQTCYCLIDEKQKEFPDGAGICVP